MSVRCHGGETDKLGWLTLGMMNDVSIFLPHRNSATTATEEGLIETLGAYWLNGVVGDFAVGCLCAYAAKGLRAGLVD